MNDKYDKNSLVFQLAKRSRTQGIGGRFMAHVASKQNLKTLTGLFDFVQSSLKYFLEGEFLSPNSVFFCTTHDTFLCYTEYLHLKKKKKGGSLLSLFLSFT